MLFRSVETMAAPPPTGVNVIVTSVMSSCSFATGSVGSSHALNAATRVMADRARTMLDAVMMVFLGWSMGSVTPGRHATVKGARTRMHGHTLRWSSGRASASDRLTEWRSPWPDRAEKTGTSTRNRGSNRGCGIDCSECLRRCSNTGSTPLTRQGPDDLAVAVVVVGRTVGLGVLDVHGLGHATRLEQRIGDRKGRGCTELREEEGECCHTAPEEPPLLQRATVRTIEKLNIRQEMDGSVSTPCQRVRSATASESDATSPSALERDLSSDRRIRAS